MNRELLEKTRTRIASVGEEGCNMDDWITTDDLFDIVRGGGLAEARLNGRGICDTPGCIAGHGIAVATGSFVRVVEKYKAWSYKDGTGQKFGEPGDRASNLLDVPITLFYEDQWPEKYQILLGDEGHAKAMLAIIDDLLSGALIFNDNEELVEAEEV